MKNKLITILPVMFGFFIMGFVDIIGMTTNYLKNDFLGLNNTITNLLAVSCFIWFLIFSVPTAVLMNYIGRKRTVQISFFIQIVAFGLVSINYSYSIVMIAFSLVGIGNAILQVALNPLVTNIVQENKLTGTLTLGQFVKAVCSFSGPLLVGWFVNMEYGWKLIFPVYAVISFIGLIWLSLTKIEEKSEKKSSVAFSKIFKLFSDKYIRAFFIGILVLVGVDVGMNITFPQFLQESCELNLQYAGLGNSVYFIARTIGALLGGMILMKVSEFKIYRISIIVGLVGLILMLLINGLWGILVCVVLFGLGYSNLFAIIFSLAIKHKPENANEISALLIMGVSGGGILPPLLGLITDTAGNQWSGIMVLTIAFIYMFAILGAVKKQSQANN